MIVRTKPGMIITHGPEEFVGRRLRTMVRILSRDGKIKTHMFHKERPPGFVLHKGFVK